MFIKPRRSRGLTAEGRRFAFSMMYERIRAADKDFTDVRLTIAQFGDSDRHGSPLRTGRADRGFHQDFRSCSARPRQFCEPVEKGGLANTVWLGEFAPWDRAGGGASCHFGRRGVTGARLIRASFTEIV